VEVPRKGWSERKDEFGTSGNFEVSVQRVRVPPGPSEDPQVGSELCDGVGNHGGDTKARESVSRGMQSRNLHHPGAQGFMMLEGSSGARILRNMTRRSPERSYLRLRF
jgi:hypothetical protein